MGSEVAAHDCETRLCHLIARADDYKSRWLQEQTLGIYMTLPIKSCHSEAKEPGSCLSPDPHAATHLTGGADAIACSFDVYIPNGCI